MRGRAGWFDGRDARGRHEVGASDKANVVCPVLCVAVAQLGVEHQPPGVSWRPVRGSGTWDSRSVRGTATMSAHCRLLTRSAAPSRPTTMLESRAVGAALRGHSADLGVICPVNATNFRSNQLLTTRRRCTACCRGSARVRHTPTCESQRRDRPISRWDRLALLPETASTGRATVRPRRSLPESTRFYRG